MHLCHVYRDTQFQYIDISLFCTIRHHKNLCEREKVMNIRAVKLFGKKPPLLRNPPYTILENARRNKDYHFLETDRFEDHEYNVYIFRFIITVLLL